MKDPLVRLFVNLLLLCLITLHESSEGFAKKTDTTAPEKFQNLLDLIRKQSAAIKSLKDASTALKVSQQKAAPKASLSTLTTTTTPEKFQNLLDLIRNQSASIKSLKDALTSLKADQQKAEPKPSISTPTISTKMPATTVPDSVSENQTKKPTTSVSSASKGTTTTSTEPVTAAPSKSTRDGSSDDTITIEQSESTSDDSSFLHQGNRFPALFMAALVFTILIYFGYHNRNKIHTFVKTGYSRSKQEAKGYVIVKLDDDIDLPPDAKTIHIYTTVRMPRSTKP